MTTLREPELVAPRQPIPAKLGRDVVFDYLRTARVDRLFGVPGTNEIPIIDGTDVPANGVHYVPCLHENIAVGAAMGYARASGRPGVVLLHVTPGIGHGLGNLYNAAKSHVPLLVLCGQQHSNLLIQEPLLESDLVQVARQFTKWSYEVRGPDEIGMAMQRALKVALSPPHGPVFLSIPWEFTIAPARDPDAGRFTVVAPRFTGDRAGITQAAEVLAGAANPVIVVGDGVGAADAWAEVAALADALPSTVEVFSEPLSSYMNYNNQDSDWQGELPGLQQCMQEKFADKDVAFLCGFNAQAQLVVFDWDLGPLIPEHVRQVYLHNDPWQIGKNHYGEAAVLGDIKATLPLITNEVAALRRVEVAPLDTLLAPSDERVRQRERRVAEVALRLDEITGEDVAIALRSLQDKDPGLRLTLVNEAVSDSGYFQKHLRFDGPTSYFVGQGGSLGYSMPAALGTRLGAGADRTVVNVVGDGSALFYPQCWWTAAKLDLAVLFVVLNNQEYKTLIGGLNEIGEVYDWHTTGDAAYLRLPPPPAVDFVTLAAGYGVSGARVTDPHDVEPALAKGLDIVRGVGGPARSHVVEVRTSKQLPPSCKKNPDWFDETVFIP
ncbi:MULTISPECIES: thiamine pyrophosphate-binding protein [unclassified Saccharothrix]|uniref:thiamine pyrophosphate-binding protein n=1 Tax=unclassified Saccharothrix TaxID=2593673 RepID=UPI00307F1170